MCVYKHRLMTLYWTCIQVSINIWKHVERDRNHINYPHFQRSGQVIKLQAGVKGDFSFIQNKFIQRDNYFCN